MPVPASTGKGNLPHLLSSHEGCTKVPLFLWQGDLGAAGSRLLCPRPKTRAILSPTVSILPILLHGDAGMSYSLLAMCLSGGSRAAIPPFWRAWNQGDGLQVGEKPTGSLASLVLINMGGTAAKLSHFRLWLSGQSVLSYQADSLPTENQHIE